MDIGESFNSAWERFFGFLPNLLGFLVILLVGYIVAKLVSKAVQKLLEKTGVDQKLHESDANKYVEKVMSGAKPSRGIARVVFWLVFAFFLFSAIGALGIPALTTFMNDVLAYLPNIIVAIAIFVIAAILAGAVAAGVTRVMGDTPTGKIVATVVPALVMIIAMFMILEQLKIAEEIVRIAFGATMFALALGLALAFGLGGRDLAGRMLEDAYRKGKDEKERVKSDLRTGRERAENEYASSESFSGGSSATYSGGSSSSGTAGNPHAEPVPGNTPENQPSHGPADDPGATQAWDQPNRY
jgi:small-conductance mechanosensitive channel